MSLKMTVPCTVYHLRMAARRTTRVYDHMLAPSGLGIAQFGLLQTLTRRGGATVTEIAADLDMDRTTLTRNLRPLVRDKLVRLGPGRDRRSRAVEMTQAGRAAMQRAVPFWKAAQACVRDSLGRDETEKLHDLLAAVISQLPAD